VLSCEKIIKGARALKLIELQGDLGKLAPQQLYSGPETRGPGLIGTEAPECRKIRPGEEHVFVFLLT